MSWEEAVFERQRKEGLMKNERGQTNAELGLVLVILSIAAIVVLLGAADSVVDLYQSIADQFPG